MTACGLSLPAASTTLVNSDDNNSNNGRVEREEVSSADDKSYSSWGGEKDCARVRGVQVTVRLDNNGNDWEGQLSSLLQW